MASQLSCFGRTGIVSRSSVPDIGDPSLSSGQRRHSCHTSLAKPSSPAVQNQRVAQLIKGTGYQSLSSVNLVNHQFYASSAPSSTLSLHQDLSSSSSPVPLFQSSPDGGLPNVEMMNAADVDLGDLAPLDGASPVFPSAMETGGCMSSGSSNFGTVSPQDLFLSEPFLSAPSSAALTTLTSPSLYNGSPEFDNFDTSPGFGNAELEVGGDGWYPLFPTESNGSTDQVSSLDGSPAAAADEVEDSGGLDAKVDGLKKTSESPPVGGRHSSVAGVGARKRDKPLPPLVYDQTDTVAAKRARNTMAARKSRERKAQRLEELEERITKLEAERDHWKHMALSRPDAK
ncbi:hypothetical protein CDD80_454 [Ophiocordyceps camponoti-rufipedis]|uniref:Cross-pathway control protein 1 n=1 Tax=Ophiocordyceps camponoti-rufipedis TaxID=2004952 RepID=A0A2C5YEE3_9HYPO|nr:hypothetical protein CDD80_454 [Ophiocordyceps camponoti-rufipedis]